MATTSDLTIIKKHILTKAQYEALETINPNDEYYVIDDDGGNVKYSNEQALSDELKAVALKNIGIDTSISNINTQLESINTSITNIDNTLDTHQSDISTNAEDIAYLLDQVGNIDTRAIKPINKIEDSDILYTDLNYPGEYGDDISYNDIYNYNDTGYYVLREDLNEITFDFSRKDSSIYPSKSLLLELCNAGYKEIFYNPDYIFLNTNTEELGFYDNQGLDVHLYAASLALDLDDYVYEDMLITSATFLVCPTYDVNTHVANEITLLFECTDYNGEVGYKFYKLAASNTSKVPEFKEITLTLDGLLTPGITSEGREGYINRETPLANFKSIVMMQYTGYDDTYTDANPQNDSAIVKTIKLNGIVEHPYHGTMKVFPVWKIWERPELTVELTIEPTEAYKDHHYRDVEDNTLHVINEDPQSGGFVLVISGDEITEGTYAISYFENDSTAWVFDGNLDKLDAENNFKSCDYWTSDDPKRLILSLNTNATCVFHFTKSETEGYWNIRSLSGYYIGRTATSNGMNTSQTTLYDNTISIEADNTVTITSTGGPKLLVYNAGSWGRFRYYKSALKPIYLFKLLEASPYDWDRTVRKSELSKVAITNEYQDLDNKPQLGNVIVNEYDILPIINDTHDNVLARIDADLYSVVKGKGIRWDFLTFPYTSFSSLNMVPFTEEILNGFQYFHADNFVTSGTLTPNISKGGLLIGSSKKNGSLDINHSIIKASGVEVYASKYSSKEAFGLIVNVYDFEGGTQSVDPIYSDYIDLTDNNENSANSGSCKIEFDAPHFILLHIESDINTGRRGIINSVVWNDALHSYTHLEFQCNKYWKKASPDVPKIPDIPLPIEYIAGDNIDITDTLISALGYRYDPDLNSFATNNARINGASSLAGGDWGLVGKLSFISGSDVYAHGCSIATTQNNYAYNRSSAIGYNSTAQEYSHSDSRGTLYSPENGSETDNTRPTYDFKVNSLTDNTLSLTVDTHADDVAYIGFGGLYRIPTIEEWQELIDTCDWDWIDNYNGTGVAGYVITGFNGNHIFLPAAGFRLGEDLSSEGRNGYYWSSSLRTGYQGNARNLYFYSGNVGMGDSNRYLGYLVRPVSDSDSIDLGLSVRWASCNAGATKPEESGVYVAWGETEPKEVYSWDTYKWGTLNNLTKYTGSDLDTLEQEDDAAVSYSTGSRRIPTLDEWLALINGATWTWVTKTYNGGLTCNGYEVEGPGGKIFLPAAGYRYLGSIYDNGYGYYLTSLLDTGDPFNCWGTSFDDYSVYRESGNRSMGNSIRPVSYLYGIDVLNNGLYWSTCNVGSADPMFYGNYYAWGETEPKDYYDWSTYKWCNGSETTLTKYCTNSAYGTVDNLTELEQGYLNTDIWNSAQAVFFGATQNNVKFWNTWLIPISNISIDGTTVTVTTWNNFKLYPEEYDWNVIQYVSFVEFTSRANNTGNISGLGTISETTKGATAVGKYNKDGAYLFMVGNGSNHRSRSNAFAVDTSGNTTAKSFNQSSDLRLKENVKPLDSNRSLEFVENVDAVSFNYKEDDKACVGFIAQDIEKYFPEAVTNSEDGYKYLDYSKLIAPLFEVVKLQLKLIVELTEKVNKLNNDK